jgi:hypothetical protein
MFIGDLLIAHGLVTTADVTAALDHQKVHGGRRGGGLVSPTLNPNSLSIR